MVLLNYGMTLDYARGKLVSVHDLLQLHIENLTAEHEQALIDASLGSVYGQLASLQGRHLALLQCTSDILGNCHHEDIATALVVERIRRYLNRWPS